MMSPVGWWAQNTPLHLGNGRRFRSTRNCQLLVPTEHRLRHQLTIGSSGSGKSRLARYVIEQDILANRSFTILDSHDLQSEVLAIIARLAFGKQKPTPDMVAQLGDKLTLIEPGDQRFGVPGLNILQTRPGQTLYEVVDAIIGTIRELWPDSHGDRMLDICRNSLLLLGELDLTIAEIVPLLSDQTFRNTLVARSNNQEVRMFFNEHLGGLRATEVKSWFESSRNKWSAFLTPFIRPILGQRRSTIDFANILADGKWLVVNLSRNRLKDSRRLLGALIITALHNAAIARESLSPEQRTFHCLFADEFQEHFCPSILELLVGARKYGVSLSLFHQATNQPPLNQDPALFDVIIQNTATICCFGVARKDAVRLAGEIFFPSGTETKYQDSILGIPTSKAQFWGLGDEREKYAQELMRQGQAEMYVRLRGRDNEPYAIQVPKVPDISIDRDAVDALRQHVARKYYKPVEVVEREIRDRSHAIRAGNAATITPDFTR